jgi:hypothetical protein
MDFYNITAKTFGQRAKQDYTIAPEFMYITKDLVCKGGSMYGYWYDGMWRTDLFDLVRVIDKDVIDYAKEFTAKHADRDVTMKLMSVHDSSVMDKFLKFTKNMPDSDVEFNTRIIFSNETPTREDYSTTQLSYTPVSGDTPAFDQMFNLLYQPSELQKILWFIGAALTNSMAKIQKFLFLYGGKGSGKGTILKVFKMLFEGYYSDIDLHKLTGGSEFATSGVKETMLLIDEDSDLYSIKDDTNLLKLTSHEPIMVNNKYQSTYTVTFKGLMVAASNQRFKVRNIDSGITRRGVVAEPTEQKHDYATYMTLMDKIQFELPQIAQKAIDVFKAKGPGFYENYVPYDMMESTDLFFSFMREHARALGDVCTLKTAAELYRTYLTDLDYDTGGYKKKVKNELKRYYKTFVDQKKVNGENVKNVYEGLKWNDIFPGEEQPEEPTGESEEDLIAEFGLREGRSAFDELATSYPSQYTNKDGNPKVRWDEVTTVLGQINTNELHFVRVPSNHIVIDFDLKNETGEKDLVLNLKAAKKFPDTYTELSKSGSGVHLHYIYDGDVEKLASEYDKDIEIKVYRGKASLRRKLSLCNNKDIAHISTGLPEKEEAFTVYKDIEVIHWNEHKLRTAVKGNLEKRYHASTRPSIDFIVKNFEDAAKAGVKYDLQDMRQDILAFAASSSNQAAYCLKAVSKIKFTTIEPEDSKDIQVAAGQRYYEKEDLWFYDVEVFPNLFIIVYKQYGRPESKVTLINPTREQVAAFVERPLVGFNNRRYDNHIIYAALLGEDNLSLYRQSQRIINDKNAGSGMYSGAYELSYTDIYDYLNAGNKMSLKKWEVKLGVKHDEFELPWDQPVPEEYWERAAEYCGNDVDATEAVFDATYSDYTARRILSEISGLSMNSTSNQQTAAIIFEGKSKRETMGSLEYTDLSKTFPGYKYAFGKSEYRGEDPGEGGYVYAEPGVYENVALLDIASMHPTSAIEMNMFGEYTKNYEDILNVRLDVKRKDYETARKRFGGRLAPYLNDEKAAKELSDALKTPINSVYGLTSAGFENQFRHPDNNDNIVAKRGALFMINLKHEVQKRGYTVAHIKTDSIKIPNADQEILDFVFDYGKQYGYTFEHEDTYKRLALVNKSTYICQDMDGEWHATGAQFADPYVFKTLFSKEPLTKSDFFVTKEVKNASVFLGEKFIGRLAEVYASETGEEMFRVANEKKGSISGTKGFKWKLSKDWSGHKDLDMTYYKDLVEKAIEAISKVGDISIMLDKPEIDKEQIQCELNDYKCIAEVYTVTGNADPYGDPLMNYLVDNSGKTIDLEEDDLPF